MWCSTLHIWYNLVCISGCRTYTLCTFKLLHKRSKIRFIGEIFNFLRFFIQYCFICRLSPPTLFGVAGIEPRLLLPTLHWQYGKTYVISAPVSCKKGPKFEFQAGAHGGHLLLINADEDKKRGPLCISALLVRRNSNIQGASSVQVLFIESAAKICFYILI